MRDQPGGGRAGAKAGTLAAVSPQDDQSGGRRATPTRSHAAMTKQHLPAAAPHAPQTG